MIQLLVHRNQLSNRHFYERDLGGDVGCLSSVSDDVEAINLSEASERLRRNWRVDEEVTRAIDDRVTKQSLSTATIGGGHEYGV